MGGGPNVLGQYLRARRELVTPGQVGIPVLRRRRVAGLRREEVAMLAGISAEHSLRLEQGRDRNPSEQVLRSIAAALQLPDESYLLSLAERRPRAPRGPARREVPPAATARLRDVFLDPGEQALFPDRHGAAAALLAGFRRSVGTGIEDPRVIGLVGELSLASADQLAFLTAFLTAFTAPPPHRAPAQTFDR